MGHEDPTICIDNHSKTYFSWPTHKTLFVCFHNLISLYGSIVFFSCCYINSNLRMDYAMARRLPKFTIMCHGAIEPRKRFKLTHPDIALLFITYPGIASDANTTDLGMISKDAVEDAIDTAYGLKHVAQEVTPYLGQYNRPLSAHPVLYSQGMICNDHILRFEDEAFIIGIFRLPLPEIAGIRRLHAGIRVLGKNFGIKIKDVVEKTYSLYNNSSITERLGSIDVTLSQVYRMLVEDGMKGVFFCGFCRALPVESYRNIKKAISIFKEEGARPEVLDAMSSYRIPKRALYNNSTPLDTFFTIKSPAFIQHVQNQLTTNRERWLSQQAMLGPKKKRLTPPEENIETYQLSGDQSVPRIPRSKSFAHIFRAVNEIVRPRAINHVREMLDGHRQFIRDEHTQDNGREKMLEDEIRKIPKRNLILYKRWLPVGNASTSSNMHASNAYTGSNNSHTGNNNGNSHNRFL